MKTPSLNHRALALETTNITFTHENKTDSGLAACNGHRVARIHRLHVVFRTVQAGTDPNITVPSGVVVYVPVTLTNSQSSAVSNGTQVKISMNWNTYSTYLDNPVDNYVFFNSTGTKLNSWLESGTNNTATAAVLWLKLDSGIAAHGSYTVYLGFTAKGTSILGSAAATGVAPNLNAVYAGATYGSLDNGANVFSFYDNFAGTSLNTKWTPWNTSQGTMSVNNGITITHTSCHQFHRRFWHICGICADNRTTGGRNSHGNIF